MGIWDKIKKSGFDDDDDETEVEQQIPEADDSSSFGSKSASPNALELKVVRPETYESVGKIADHLINRKTVVLNLEATNKETAKRLIDFLSGVAYSINGTIRRVATNTFVITPANVGISGEAAATDEAPKAAPKAQSDDFTL